MPTIVTPYERIAEFRARTRLGEREFMALVGIDARNARRPPKWLIAKLDAWEAAGIEIGRPVPTVTYTMGWPFDGERRKR